MVRFQAQKKAIQMIVRAHRNYAAVNNWANAAYKMIAGDRPVRHAVGAAGPASQIVNRGGGWWAFRP